MHARAMACVTISNKGKVEATGSARQPENSHCCASGTLRALDSESLLRSCGGARVAAGMWELAFSLISSFSGDERATDDG